MDLLLLESIFSKCKLCLFEQGISCSIFISILYIYKYIYIYINIYIYIYIYTSIRTNKVIHNPGSQVYHLSSTNMGVSPLHGVIAASLRITQIYIKIDKAKIKPYLHYSHSIGYCFYLQKHPDSIQCYIFCLDLFCLSDNGI